MNPNSPPCKGVLLKQLQGTAPPAKTAEPGLEARPCGLSWLDILSSLLDGVWLATIITAFGWETLYLWGASGPFSDAAAAVLPQFVGQDHACVMVFFTLLGIISPIAMAVRSLGPPSQRLNGWERVQLGITIGIVIFVLGILLSWYFIALIGGLLGKSLGLACFTGGAALGIGIPKLLLS